MFAALTNVKLVIAGVTAAAGIAAGSQSANAERFRPNFGVNVVLAQPACPQPVVVAQPVCPPQVVYAPAPVYAQPYYGPSYVVANGYWHHHWAPTFTFRGGRHW